MARAKWTAAAFVGVCACGTAERVPAPAPPATVEPVAPTQPTVPPARSCEDVKQVLSAAANKLSTACSTDGDCRTLTGIHPCGSHHGCGSLYVSRDADIEGYSNEVNARSAEYKRACGDCGGSVVRCRAPAEPVCRDGRCQPSS